MARCPIFLAPFVIVLAVSVGCTSSSDSNGSAGGNKGKKQFLSMGTAPPGGAFAPVGNALAEVLNAHKGEYDWKVSGKGTKGSQENIRRLQKGELQLGLSNAAISYFAVRGEGTWEEKCDVRAIATMAPNVALFIARADSGVQTIADLKGKTVIVGPAGAGFQMFVEPILEEHGVSWSELTVKHSNQTGAVDQLGDGSADAAFLGGAVPTASITQATATFDVQFIPFDPEARQRLIDKYAFFHPATIPADTYKGLESDFQGLNVGSMHLITSAAEDEDLIYHVTKTIWENREEIAGKHPAGRAIKEGNVVRDTGIEYHPGAKRFYEEAGLWPASEAAAGSETGEAEVPPAEEGADSSDTELNEPVQTTQE